MGVLRDSGSTAGVAALMGSASKPNSGPKSAPESAGAGSGAIASGVAGRSVRLMPSAVDTTSVSGSVAAGGSGASGSTGAGGVAIDGAEAGEEVSGGGAIGEDAIASAAAVSTGADGWLGLTGRCLAGLSRFTDLVDLVDLVGLVGLVGLTESPLALGCLTGGCRLRSPSCSCLGARWGVVPMARVARCERPSRAAGKERRFACCCSWPGSSLADWRTTSAKVRAEPGRRVC